MLPRKTPILNDEPRPDRLRWFKTLKPDEKAVEDYSAIITESCEFKNFHWCGGGGIFVGPNGRDSVARRLRPKKEISVLIDGCKCEDVGWNALEIHAGSTVIVRDCFFRGNWKMDPYLEGGNGQENLVLVNGGQVLFENCKFYNSRIPIKVKSNSTVGFKDCHFYVCEVAVEADGRDNPRKNDTYYDGWAGPSHVGIINCTTFKVGTVALCHPGGNVKIEGTSNEGGQLFIREGANILP